MSHCLAHRQALHSTYDPMKILYKPIRHGYARIDDEWKLVISIPHRLRNNTAFQDALVAKWKLLLARYQKKTQIQISDDESIFLFGEQIPLADVFPTKTSLGDNSPSQILQDTLIAYATPLLDYYSEQIGRKYQEITVKKSKSKRWSCTYHQHISLNLNLVHLPTKYIRYVIIHECCHLKIKNHSKQFRALVEHFCPGYKTIRKEMRAMIMKSPKLGHHQTTKQGAPAKQKI